MMINPVRFGNELDGNEPKPNKALAIENFNLVQERLNQYLNETDWWNRQNYIQTLGTAGAGTGVKIDSWI